MHASPTTLHSTCRHSSTDSGPRSASCFEGWQILVMCELIACVGVLFGRPTTVGSLYSQVRPRSQGQTRAAGVMVCVLAHVGLGDIFRLVGHHSATLPSLRKPSPVRVQHLQTAAAAFPLRNLYSKILNGSASSRGKRIRSCRGSSPVYQFLLVVKSGALSLKIQSLDLFSELNPPAAGTRWSPTPNTIASTHSLTSHALLCTFPPWRSKTLGPEIQ